MNETNVILGIQIRRCESGLMLMQEHYVERLLEKFGHHDVNLVSTLYDAKTN